MQAVTEWSLRFLDEHAQLALFVWLFLEEAGLPMPIPGDLVILGAGARIGQGRLHWAVGLVLVEAATLLGSTTLFWLSRQGGHPMLIRFGRYLRLDPERLVRSEAFLRRRGFLAVVIGRLTPGLRVLTTVAAGAFGVPYRQFLPASLVGSNNLVLLLAGYFVGPELLRAVEGLRVSPWLVGALAGVAILVSLQVLIRRRAHLSAAASDLPEPIRLETALLAGLLATATTVAAINAILYLLAALGQTSGAEALFAFTLRAGRRLEAGPVAVLLAAGVVLYVALHLAWALAYAHVERWLPEPDWLGGLLFALGPLAISVLVILPALGAGIGGLGLGMGAVPLVGETVRHAVYGWSLSSSYTVLSRARGRARRPGRPAGSLATEPTSGD
jgi:membrane protein DedA with SNARE-associated domain